MNSKRAFIVRDEIAEVEVVIFHHHQVAARREGAEDLCVGFSDVSIRRYPAFDRYSPGPVPRKILTDHGLRRPERTKTLVHDRLRSELKSRLRRDFV